MRDHIGDDNNMVTDAGWTAEKPTAAGWYWLIENGWSEPEVVQVKEVGILWRVYFSSGRRDDLKFVDGEWLGPITPDDRAQGRVEGLQRERDEWRSNAVAQEARANDLERDCKDLLSDIDGERAKVGDLLKKIAYWEKRHRTYRELAEENMNLKSDELSALQGLVRALQRERDAILKAINDSTYTDRRGRRCMAFKQLEEVIGKIEGSGKGGPTGRVDALSECARCHGPMPVQTTGGSRKRYCSTTCKDSDRDPVKLASRLALKTAVNRGEIVRPDSCQRCGKSEALIEGHHHDYAKPLDVQWLCPKCHAATHMEMRANGQNI